MNLFQTVRIAGFAAAATALASCSSLDSRVNVGPCPLAGALYEATRLVELSGGERHDNVGFTAEIEGVRGYCRYVDKNPITMEIEIDFAFGKGPAAASDQRTYEYFVAVTRRDRSVLAKEKFSREVRFPRGSNTVRITEKVDGIVIPRATETVSGSNFEVLAGLELTPEQLAYNRSGKRFLMEVK